MVLPLAAAVPWIASAVGSMLPMIVDSFRSGKSPEEAQKMIAPQRQAMVERLIGSGMNMQQAEAMTDEAMADELAKAQLPEPMNPWLTAALAIGGGIGGYKLGTKFAKGAPTPDVSKEAKIDTPAEQAIAKPASGQAPSQAPSKMTMDDAETQAAQVAGRPAEMRDEILEDLTRPKDMSTRRVGYSPGNQSPIEAGYNPVVKDAEVMSVRNSGPFPSPSPPMDPDFAALNMGGQVPGRSTRRFTMVDDSPFPRQLGMDPALRNKYEVDAMRGSMYRYEGG